MFYHKKSFLSMLRACKTQMDRSTISRVSQKNKGKAVISPKELGTPGVFQCDSNGVRRGIRVPVVGFPRC